jgi:hypothetical protein
MRVVVCSWFDKARLKIADRVVSISLSEPRGAKFNAKIKEFVPAPELLAGYKNGHLDIEEYCVRYRKQVYPNLPAGIGQLRDGDALCCWEREGVFCHRRILAELLTTFSVEVEIH